MHPRYTVAEIAEKLDVTKEAARGLVRYLIDAGFASERGVRAPEGGRGRGENVYSFSDEYEKALVTSLKRAKLT